MDFLLPSLLSGAAFTLTSCVLPVPNVTVVREGVSGEVVTEGTARPIAGAEVSVAYDGAATQSATTGRRGFRIPGEYLWNWGYMIGPITSPLPYRGPRETARVRGISIRAQGYADYLWQAGPDSGDKPPDTFRLQPRHPGI